jgi:hypothetical protein
MTCNGILKPGEKSCYGCGERAPKQKVGPSLRKRVDALLTVVFIGSLALTAASLVFSDHTPPFTGCLTASVVLLFVKRSSNQLAGPKS